MYLIDIKSALYRKVILFYLLKMFSKTATYIGLLMAYTVEMHASHLTRLDQNNNDIKQNRTHTRTHTRAHTHMATSKLTSIRQITD